MTEIVDEKQLEWYAALDPTEWGVAGEYYAAKFACEIVRLRKELVAAQQDAARFAKLRKLARGRCTMRPNVGLFGGGYTFDDTRYDISVPVAGRYVNRETEALTQSFTDALDAMEEPADGREEETKV